MKVNEERIHGLSSIEGKPTQQTPSRFARKTAGSGLYNAKKREMDAVFDPDTSSVKVDKPRYRGESVACT